VVVGIGAGAVVEGIGAGVVVVGIGAGVVVVGIGAGVVVVGIGAGAGVVVKGGGVGVVVDCARACSCRGAGERADSATFFKLREASRLGVQGRGSYTSKEGAKQGDGQGTPVAG
jgi:hypothetical protein